MFKFRKPIRIRKLTLETERTFIFRSRGRSRTGWCEQCEANVELMSVADAAREMGLNELMIYKLIHTGDIHCIEDDDVHIVVCLNSLRRVQVGLEEQNREGESYGTQE
jgi:hypothetical protein